MNIEPMSKIKKRKSASGWDIIPITLDNGETAEAQAPVIVSASRSTDIPAFYADWFFDRLKKGYSAWTNPFNNKKSYVSYEKTRFIVFWSKNPKPLLENGILDYLKEKSIGCYIQFTLNDYVKEELEKNVPPVAQRIDTFKKLVDKLGIGHVIWRFDPLVLTESISEDILFEKIANIGDQLRGYTEKLVFSFADIKVYRKVQINLRAARIPYREWTIDAMFSFAKKLSELNTQKGWDYKLATCGEEIDLKKLGIQHNHCVDDELMIRFGYKDDALMKCLNAEICKKDATPKKMVEQNLFDSVGAPSSKEKKENELPDGAISISENEYVVRGNNKDMGQRKACGCMKSKDIGEYNTCIHGCEYCYANTSKETAKENYKRHKANPNADTITGKE